MTRPCAKQLLPDKLHLAGWQDYRWHCTDRHVDAMLQGYWSNIYTALRAHAFVSH
jgi:hypothetical protein